MSAIRIETSRGYSTVVKILRTLAPAVIVAAVGYSLFFIGFLSTWRNLEQLAKHGLTTDGIVIVKEPKNHESVRYEYWVEGVKYSGVSPAAMNGLPKFADIRVGDTITVTYRPDTPSQSFGGYRPDVYVAMSNFLFYLLPITCVILGIGTAIVLHLRRASKDRERVL